MRHERDDTEVEHLPVGARAGRIIVRPMEDRDAPAIKALIAAPLLAGEGIAAAAARATDHVTLSIVSTETGLVIGQAAHQALTDARLPVEISLWLDPAEWGKGYGTEAVQALVDRAFADRRIGALWAALRVTNARARRVLEKSGFQFRGGGMERLAGAPGAHPVERFVIDRSSWVSLKAWGATQGRSATRSDAA
ncbi:MAG: GNAT family N-acetyltransferase [Alphaproteobacteria bacterium]